jgi:hypothetical protein
MSTKRAWVDSLLLLFLSSILIWPLFRLEYLNNWPSIESTFIADARMLSDRLPHPGWQPLWYCGTRFDYIYPPALRYGTAIISKFGGVSTARAYHLYTAILYVFGILAVYWLVRIGSNSRYPALLAAAAAALLSPSFLLLPIIRHDSAFWVPQRLHVLMAYGEGPHISALSILPAALALSFLALRRWTPLTFAGASALCAFTVANNFYGATALAIFFPIVTWSVWVCHREPTVWLRAAGIPALAYALCAFWLTPSYLRITAFNLSLVAPPGNTWSRVTMLAVLVAFGALTWRWGNGRPERAWKIFVIGAGLFLTLYVVGFYDFGLRVIGDAPRLIPELDLALILISIEVLRTLWQRRGLRLITAVIAIVVFYPATHYLRHVYFPFPKAPTVGNQYEYVLAKWTHDHLGDQRVLPSGSVRFWFDAWFDNPQQDGGSNQGMLNPVLPTAEYQITNGDRGDFAILWMQALGTDAVIVPDKTSPEPYHDYTKPEKFRGLLPVLYDDGHGTVIYRVPRLYTGIGRVVDTAKLAAIQAGTDLSTLSSYVSLVENVQQNPTQVTWKSFEEVEIQAHVSSGQSVLLQETYDSAWHAYENGKPVRIHIEPVMNFMLIDVPEGNHGIQMRFETPLENRIGQVISLLGLAVVICLVVYGVATPAP